jgi:CBS domain-containing protein
VASVVEEDFTSVYPDESINVLIPLLQRYKLVVVYDSDHKLIGQVSAGDLLKKYRPDNGIEPVIEKVITIEADERVVHLRRRMLDDNITRFVVSDNNKYTGIVTETDVAIAMRKFREAIRDQHQDHRIRNLLVKDIMTSPLMSVERTADVSAVIDLMLKKNISSVPVMDNGRLFGIITRQSLVNAL